MADGGAAGVGIREEEATPAAGVAIPVEAEAAILAVAAEDASRARFYMIQCCSPRTS